MKQLSAFIAETLESQLANFCNIEKLSVTASSGEYIGVLASRNNDEERCVTYLDANDVSYAIGWKRVNGRLEGTMSVDHVVVTERNRDAVINYVKDIGHIKPMSYLPDEFYDAVFKLKHRIPLRYVLLSPIATWWYASKTNQIGKYLTFSEGRVALRNLMFEPNLQPEMYSLLTSTMRSVTPKRDLYAPIPVWLYAVIKQLGLHKSSDDITSPRICSRPYHSTDDYEVYSSILNPTGPLKLIHLPQPDDCPRKHPDFVFSYESSSNPDVIRYHIHTCDIFGANVAFEVKKSDLEVEDNYQSMRGLLAFMMYALDKPDLWAFDNVDKKYNSEGVSTVKTILASRSPVASVVSNFHRLTDYDNPPKLMPGRGRCRRVTPIEAYSYRGDLYRITFD